MTNVKKEIFGSRNSNLKNYFEKNKIDNFSFFVFYHYKSLKKELFFVYEKENNKQDYSKEFKKLMKKFNINNYFILELKNENKLKINFKDELKEFNKNELKEFILNLVNCNLVPDYQKGSLNSSFFSRFFRENMGKGFVLTDIDFYLPKLNIFIEEKTFLKDDKYLILPYGQFKLFNLLPFKNKLNILTVIKNDIIYQKFNNLKYTFQRDKKWGPILIIKNLKTNNIENFFKQNLKIKDIINNDSIG